MHKRYEIKMNFYGRERPFENYDYYKSWRILDPLLGPFITFITWLYLFICINMSRLTLNNPIKRKKKSLFIYLLFCKYGTLKSESKTCAINKGKTK